MIAASGLEGPEGAAMSADDMQAEVEQGQGRRPQQAAGGRHPVNEPMMHHWLDAIGDRNPIYVDEAAAKAAGHPGDRRAAGDDPGVDHDGPGRGPP